MQLVIDIPDEHYARWKEEGWYNPLVIDYALKEGKELPRGHGRLIDADEATRSCLEHTGKRSLLIDLAPTVIEADVTDINVGKKEEEDGRN